MAPKENAPILRKPRRVMPSQYRLAGPWMVSMRVPFRQVGARAGTRLFQARSRTPLTCHVRNGSGAEALGLIHNSKAFGYPSQEGLPKMRKVATRRDLGLLE